MISYFNGYNRCTRNWAFVLGCDNVSGNNTKTYSRFFNITSNQIFNQCNLRLDLDQVVRFISGPSTFVYNTCNKRVLLYHCGKGGCSYITAGKIGSTTLT